MRYVCMFRSMYVCNGVDDSAKSYVCLLDNYTTLPHNVGYYHNSVYLAIKRKHLKFKNCIILIHLDVLRMYDILRTK